MAQSIFFALSCALSREFTQMGGLVTVGVRVKWALENICTIPAMLPGAVLFKTRFYRSVVAADYWSRARAERIA